MAYSAKSYVGGVTPATLAADLAAGTTGSITLNIPSTATTGWANLHAAVSSTAKCVMALDYGTSSEEKVLVSAVGAVVGTTVSITIDQRGYDGTSAAVHSAANNYPVLPVAAAVDFQEANTAVVNTVGKVGAAGDLLVGTGANAMTNLAVGSARSILTGGTTPAWLAASAANLVPVTDGGGITWQPAVWGNPSARIYASAATSVASVTSIPGTAAGTTITAIFDYVNGGMTVASNQITIPTTGYYALNCAVQLASVGSAYNTTTNIVRTRGGVDTIVGQWIGRSAAGIASTTGGSVTVSANAGDKFSFASRQDSGSAINCTTGSNATWLSATLVSI